MYYQVRIIYQAKYPGKSKNWEDYDKYSKDFKTIEEAKAYINEQFFRVKTKKRSYVDMVSGGRIPTGWVYSWKDRDLGGDFNYQRAWVSLLKLEQEPIPF